MKIVILGGSGFLGQALASRLCALDYEVVTISRSPIPSLGDNHSHADVTLDDHHQLSRLLVGAEFLFHFASDSTPGSSRLQPSLEGLNNILPTLRLLEQLQESSSARLVYISSGGAVYDYRQASEGGYVEESATNPMSYYGAAKLAIEQFIQAYAQQTGNRATILRPSNIYGPGQVPKKQFGIIPTLFDALISDQPFTIWGDGSAVRDYLYISDFMALCEALLTTGAERNTLETFNVGSGRAYAISELCQTVEAVTGRQLKIEYQPLRGVDIPRVLLNSDKASQQLGWSANTSLAAGLKETWKWYQNKTR